MEDYVQESCSTCKKLPTCTNEDQGESKREKGTTNEEELATFDYMNHVMEDTKGTISDKDQPMAHYVSVQLKQAKNRETERLHTELGTFISRKEELEEGTGAIHYLPFQTVKEENILKTGTGGQDSPRERPPEVSCRTFRHTPSASK